MPFGPVLCSPTAPTLGTSGSEPLVRGMSCGRGSAEHELRRLKRRHMRRRLPGDERRGHKRCRGSRHLGPRHVSRRRRPGGPAADGRSARPKPVLLRSARICSSLPPAPRGGDSHATAPLARRVRLPAGAPLRVDAQPALTSGTASPTALSLDAATCHMPSTSTNVRDDTRRGARRTGRAAGSRARVVDVVSQLTRRPIATQKSRIGQPTVAIGTPSSVPCTVSVR